jgi:SAM-dependent methyltransferase
MHDNPRYWDSFSGHALDAAVIDPGDSRGHKNRYIATLRNQSILEALDGADIEKVLDFGSGTGSLTQALIEAGMTTIGVDISMGLLQRSRQRDLGPKAMMVQIDGMLIPLRNASVDAAVTYIVLMYLTDERLVSLRREVSRVLKPGARFVVMEQFRSRQQMIVEDGKLHRSLDNFVALAEEAGFHCESSAVCRYGHFPILYAIRYGLISERFFGVLRKTERLIGRCFGILPWDYVDVRVVLTNTGQGA